MRKLSILSASEQLAEYLKAEIRDGRWTEKMPGESRLVTQFQLGRDTVRAALAQLEEEGVLLSQGQGKQRRIVLERHEVQPRSIRIRIMLYEKRDRADVDNSSVLAELLAAGFDAGFEEKSLKELGMDAERVARYVKKHPADAWVVSSGSREVLEWFAGQATPVIAMYGRGKGIPIARAYTIMIPGIIAATRRLIELGHKRIVMITREERRKPRLSEPELAFVNTLEAAGIKTGDYNLPDWKETREGLTHLLEELFRHSPPTSLMFQEAPILLASLSYLASRGIVAPRDVSMVVADRDASFAWCDPTPSHIDFNYWSVVRRVVRWAENVSRGQEDLRQVGTESKFIEGGTIGPVPGRIVTG